MKDLKTKWDLSSLLPKDEAGIDEFITSTETAYKAFVDKWEKRKDYLEDTKILKEALDEFESLARNFDGTGGVGYYFWLRHHQDLLNPDIKSQNNRIHQIELKLANSLEFFTNRLSKIKLSKQKLFLNSPLLSEYRHFLEKLFESGRYILSEPEEKILNLKSQTSFGNWVRMVTEFVSKEERDVLLEDGTTAKKPFSDFINLLQSQNKDVRDASAAAMNDVTDKYADVAEHELNSILLDKKINDELRGIERPDKSRHMSDDIETEVVDALIEAVSRRFDISSRYYGLKAKLMGVPKLAYHERNVLLGDLNKKYSYEKSIEIVENTFKSLDKEFYDIFREMILNGRIDVYPERGKYGGAFCTHRRLKDPTYILLNFSESLNDVTTLAHEMGHAINNVFISRASNSLNNDTPLSTAEVASTFMEDFVFEHAAEEYKPKDRLYILMEKLNDDISTIFRQVSCYKFEQELHKVYRQNNHLTKEQIGQLFTHHMSAYMGDCVEQTPGSQNWWVYWSHIRSFFYVYSYASGLLISKSLQNMVRSDPSTISKVKTFLSAGLSESPKKLFMDMEIDVTDVNFWNKGLNEVDELLKEAESLASRLQPSN